MGCGGELGGWRLNVAEREEMEFSQWLKQQEMKIIEQSGIREKKKEQRWLTSCRER